MQTKLSLGVLVVATALCADAAAAGLFLAPRGVRPLARGGSFVAGADDVNALSYNPAGLSEAQDSVLVDAALPVHMTRYTRSVYGDGTYEAPVTGSGMGMPSPTLGIIHDFGLAEGLRFGFGVAADYPAMQNWPDQSDAPQRYAVGNYRGTAMSKLSAGAGYRVNDWLSVGGALQLLVGSFTSTTTVSACDGALCTQPENPDYDTTIQMRADGLVVPGAHLGIQLRPREWLHVGLAWESGYTIDHTATFRMRLPSASSFRDATLDPVNPTGRVRMQLPQQFRSGIELRPSDNVRVEADFVYDPWAVHNRVDVDVGNTTIRNMFALGSYGMAPMSLDRGFRNTWSTRLGGEWRPARWDGQPVTLRAGLMYEPSAVPQRMLTPMTVDLDKVLGAVGLQYSVEQFHFEATYAHIFMADRTVTESAVYQANPTRPPWDGRTPIGNGQYHSHANLFGLGMRVDI